MKLYHYWRSSSSWRVRWALKFKGIDAELIHVSLLSGESETLEHLKRHPLGYVPVIEDAGQFIIESVAIIEWLEEKFPERPLLPVGGVDRAHVRALVEIINSDTQPVQNLTVLDFYSEDVEKRTEWSRHFIQRGLSAYEKLCGEKSGAFSFGDTVTAADLFLIPQVYNAIRFGMALDEFKTVKKIYENALLLPELIASHPDRFR
jgi:maleylacetoacetate isomerase